MFSKAWIHMAVVACSLAQAAHAQSIRVTVRNINGVEVNVGSLHNSGAAINITTRDLAEAARSTLNP